jgi:hypothetical protein
MPEHAPGVTLGPAGHYTTPQAIHSASQNSTLFDRDLQLLPEWDPGPTIPEKLSKSESRPILKRALCEFEDVNTIDMSACKRKWQESVTVFSLNGGKKVVPSRRNNFNPSRRIEVALNRQLGSCVQCKVHRGPVSCSNRKLTFHSV